MMQPNQFGNWVDYSAERSAWWVGKKKELVHLKNSYDSNNKGRKEIYHERLLLCLQNLT